MLEAAMEDSRQAQHRAGLEHQHALLALQGQLNNAVGEMDVLRAGAGHAKDEALSALKVCMPSARGFHSTVMKLHVASLSSKLYNPCCSKLRVAMFTIMFKEMGLDVEICKGRSRGTH